VIIRKNPEPGKSPEKLAKFAIFPKNLGTLFMIIIIDISSDVNLCVLK
jgi:hypothetical protein